MTTRTPTETAHIWLDERGRAWIDDTNVKVLQVVMDKIGPNHLTPEEMIEHHYGVYTLAQVYAALSYYYDHKAELDAEMERQMREFEELRRQSLNSPGRQKLRALGLIP